MVSARPLLRSLKGPAMNLADAGGENVRTALMNRIKAVVHPSTDPIAHTPPEAPVNAAMLNRLTSFQATPASLDMCPRFESLSMTPPTVAAPVGQFDSPHLLVHPEGPLAHAVLTAAAGGRITSAIPPPITSTREVESFPEPLPQRTVTPLNTEPGSPKRRQKPSSLTAGPGTGTDTSLQASEIRSTVSGERQLHQLRDLSVVTASANERKAFFLDTLALVRRLEAEGLTAQQAEAITHVITDVLHESLESAANTFVSKAEMQKSELMNEATMSRLRTELQSGSDVRLAGIGQEVEGLKTDLDKLKSEMKYEVDKMASDQRLDLNLERGRVKEEINAHAQESSNISNKLDREVNALKAELEAAKFEVIRYCVGTLVSVSAVGLGMLRVLM